MTDAIGLTRAITPTPDTQVSTSSSQLSSAALTTKTSTSAQQDAATAISPRLVYNPVAGVVVTQFLGNGGEVELQLPSKAAIAYLQAGLTQTGAPRSAEDIALGASA